MTHVGGSTKDRRGGVGAVLSGGGAGKTEEGSENIENAVAGVGGSQVFSGAQVDNRRGAEDIGEICVVYIMHFTMHQ